MLNIISRQNIVKILEIDVLTTLRVVRIAISITYPTQTGRCEHRDSRQALDLELNPSISDALTLKVHRLITRLPRLTGPKIWVATIRW